MKLKNFLIITIAILTIGLFVACNDEVVAAKDNNVAYTQVLESNGAFEYAGTKYETLADALKAIADGKGDASKTIKVLRDAKTGSATVPATTDSVIVLDLNGNSLSFLSSTGVTVNGNFKVTGDGEITLADKSADATAFVVGNGGKFTVENTVFNVADQYAVKAAGNTATVEFKSGAAVAGNIAASDSATVTLADSSDVSGAKEISSSAKLNINSASADKVTGPITLNGGNATVKESLALTDVAPIAMQGTSQLSVNTGAAAYISEFDSTCTIYCNVSDAASITAAEGVEIPTSSFVFGFCYVASGEEKVYFTSLEEAVTSAGENGTVTYVRDHSETGASDLPPYSVNNTVTVNMSTFKEDSKLTIASGKTLTLQGGTTKATIANTISGDGSLVAENIQFNETISLAGTIGLTNCVIDPVNLTASNDQFVKSGAPGTTVAAITMSGVEFKTKAVANTDTVYYAGVWASKGGSILMTNSTGTAFKITATNDVNTSTSLGTVTIDNSALTSGSFTVKDEVTSRVGDDPNEYVGDVTITGCSTNTSSVVIEKIYSNDITIHYATVKSEVNAKTSKDPTDVGDIVSDNSVFEATVYLTGTLTDGKNDGTDPNPKYYAGSTFSNSVTGAGTGALTFYASNFNNSTTAPAIGAKGNISIYNGKTKAGNITISGGSSEAKVLIDNSTASAAFEVGTISNSYVVENVTSYGDVEVKGKYVAATTTTTVPVDNRVTVAGVSSAKDVKTSNAIVTGDIGSSTTAVASVSDGWTDGTTTVVGKSTFNGNIYASGAGTFNNSTFTPATATTADKTLQAETLTITGATFNKTSTYGYNLDATKTYEASTDVVSISSSSGSIGTISATGNGNIKLEAVTGETGAISTENGGENPMSVIATSGSITIDNTATSVAASLKTGSLTARRWTSGSNPKGYDAFGDVTVKGNKNTDADTPVSRVVTVDGSIGANEVVVSYVTVNDSTQANSFSVTGTTTTYCPGIITSDNSTFAGGVSGAKLIDGNSTADPKKDGSTFNGNVTITAFESTTGDGSASFYKSRFVASADNSAISGKTLYISSSTFDATRPYALTATGSDYGTDPVTSALLITTSTGSVASLTTTAGSINVTNSAADAALTVTGNVLAGVASSTYFDVTLVGNANVTGDTPVVKNVVVNGTINGNDIILTQTTVKDNVTAHDVTSDAGSVTATNSTFDTSNDSDKKVSGSRLSFTTSTFTDQTNVYALEATGADYSSISALYINTSTGKVASLTSKGGSITINNSAATAALTTGSIIATSSGSATLAGSEYGVHVISGNDTAGTVMVNGVIAGDEVLIEDGTSHKAGTFSKTGHGDAEYVCRVANIYGGSHGEAESVCISADEAVNIHGGKFYVSSYSDLRIITTGIHGLNNDAVDIYIKNNIDLTATGANVLVIGRGDTWNDAKPVTFYSSNSSSNYYIEASAIDYIDVKSGNVSFATVNITNDNSDDVSVKVRQVYAQFRVLPTASIVGKTVSYN